MSTRGFYGYKLNNQIQGVQLNSDAYLEYAGEKILTIIKHSTDNELLNFWRNQIKLVGEMEIIDLESELNIDLDIDQIQAKGWKLLDILPEKLDFFNKLVSGITRKKPEAEYFYEAGRFYTRAVFCEYVYILNFDIGALEVWRGYNHSPEIGFEDWFEKGFDGEIFYMNKLDTISFKDIRKREIDTILENLKDFEEIKSDKYTQVLINRRKNELENKPIDLKNKLINN